MSAILVEFVGALLRWFHVIAGIAWVGASFYFIWVENSLNRQAEAQRGEEVAGHLWAIHGGGFYYLEKYRAAPSSPLPAPLHWFKWEAYATWLSGMALMFVVYYLNAESWLLKAGSSLSGGAATALSLAFLILGYAVYAALCRTPLLARPLLLAVVGLLFVLLFLLGLELVFSPRAAWLHIGALIGTLMAGNVAMVIIPTQKRMVAAAERGEPPNLVAAGRAGLRSLHNNYLALPVVFLMLSGHFPIFINHAGAPVSLLLVMISAFLIRHVFNCHHRRQPIVRWLSLSVLSVLLMAAHLAVSVSRNVETTAATTADPYAVAKSVIVKHCLECHATKPAHSAYASPPAGLVLETDEQIGQARERIYQRAVLVPSMPPGNLTDMTKEERAALGVWSGRP